MRSRASSIAPIALLIVLLASGPGFADGIGGGDADLGSSESRDRIGRNVTALGRLEPSDGVIRLAGPARPSVVILELLVSEGDRVEKGQRIAVLDTFALQTAEVTRLEAELASAERELARVERLARGGVSSSANRDVAQTAATVATANLERAQAELARSTVTAPVAGEILDVHAKTGERVGPAGIAELGQTDEMYAVAEVYETDIRFVKVGQQAVVTSPALARPIKGTVERIGRKVGKNDVLSSDPAAKTDARVVEVRIRLEDASATSGLTNLQVEVELEI
jgi:HlyD family secretion protein